MVSGTLIRCFSKREQKLLLDDDALVKIQREEESAAVSQGYFYVLF